jgi:hypothetical protein
MEITNNNDTAKDVPDIIIAEYKEFQRYFVNWDPIWNEYYNDYLIEGSDKEPTIDYDLMLADLAGPFKPHEYLMSVMLPNEITQHILAGMSAQATTDYFVYGSALNGPNAITLFAQPAVSRRLSFVLLSWVIEKSTASIDFNRDFCHVLVVILDHWSATCHLFDPNGTSCNDKVVDAVRKWSASSQWSFQGCNEKPLGDTIRMPKFAQGGMCVNAILVFASTCWHSGNKSFNEVIDQLQTMDPKDLDAAFVESVKDIAIHTKNKRDSTEST